MLKKLCSKCGKLIPYGKYRCNECELKYQAKYQANKDNYYKSKIDYYKKYNAEKRVNQDFYNSKSWSLARKQVSNRDRGLCRLCYSKGIINYSECVHHIEEVSSNIELRCEATNLISLCNKCHKEVHILYKSKADKIKQQLKDILLKSI